MLLSIKSNRLRYSVAEESGSMRIFFNRAAVLNFKTNRPRSSGSTDASRHRGSTDTPAGGAITTDSLSGGILKVTDCFKISDYVKLARYIPTKKQSSLNSASVRPWCSQNKPVSQQLYQNLRNVCPR